MSSVVFMTLHGSLMIYTFTTSLKKLGLPWSKIPPGKSKKSKVLTINQVKKVQKKKIKKRKIGIKLLELGLELIFLGRTLDLTFQR